MITSVVLPTGAPELSRADPVGPVLPVMPDPVIDGGDDRLVVVTRPPTADRPSATLVAAQQLSDEADRDPHRLRGAAAVTLLRRRQRALVAERRASRAASVG